MKNIFIEGLQGAGKSTLLENIAAKYPELHVCREGDASPVDLAWCTWMTEAEYHQTLKQYQPLREEIIRNTRKEGEHYVVTYTKILTDLPNFHRELESFEIYNGRKTLGEFEEIVCSRYWNFSETGYLFECSFFQNITEELILFQQLSDEEIVAFYRKLYKGIDKEKFQLIYLYSERPEEQIKMIKKERSDNHGNELWYPVMFKYLVKSPYGKQHGYQGFEDMAAHFKHRQQLEVRIIQEVIGDNAAILPAKNWRMEEVIHSITHSNASSSNAGFR